VEFYLQKGGEAGKPPWGLVDKLKLIEAIVILKLNVSKEGIGAREGEVRGVGEQRKTAESFRRALPGLVRARAPRVRLSAAQASPFSLVLGLRNGVDYEKTCFVTMG